MIDIENKLAHTINKFLQKHNIDPIYFYTIMCVAIALSYIKVYKNWENVEYWRKGLALSAAFGAVVLTIISILRLFKIIDL